MLLPVELHQPLQHHCARGHVDTQCQCLGGKYRLHQPLGEEFLDGVPEDRQHAGMVGGDTAQQPLTPLPVAENVQVRLGQPFGAAVDDGNDLPPVFLGGEAQPGSKALRHSAIAASTRKDECDRR